MILSCVYRIRDTLGYDLGINLIASVLRGSKLKRILELKLDGLSTYGLLKNKSRSQIHAMIDHLEGEGYLKTEPEYQTVSLTAEASAVLYRGQKVIMKVEKELLEDGGAAGLAPEQGELYDSLRELRARLAREAGIPAYVVFSNATLTDMAKKKPRNMSQFKKVSGVGELKAAWYGKAFLECIRTYGDGQS